MAYTQIRTERRGQVLLLTLDRPEKLNAWTPTMSAELLDAITAANDDPEIGAVVVTGAGRGFCAGADVAEVFAARIDGDDDASAGRPERPWVETVRAAKPLVAAVNGPAVGVGLSMILSFDWIVAAESAKLSLRFVKMGVAPELASSYFAPQRMGFARAADLMLSGRFVLGPEAVEIGLADELAADDGVVDAAVARAASYAENPQPQLRWIKALLNQNAADTDLAAVQRREHDVLARCYASPEHAEAVAAFREGRAPDFARHRSGER